MARAPDLLRSAGGLTVALTMAPSLRSPRSALVELRYLGERVDCVCVAPALACDAFHHPALYSRALCERLTMRGDDCG